MRDYKPITILPQDIQLDWRAVLHQATPNPNGQFKLVNIRRTRGSTYEEMRIIVLVIDENGVSIPGIKVAFSYSTAGQYAIGRDFTWLPPSPHRADIVPTEGGGQIDHVQGSVVKDGQPGGVTVYIVEPEYSSDYITGAGALFDHTGLHLTFQLRRNGVVPLNDRLADIERRLDEMEGNLMR